eukprot:scaffold840_cov344-Pavlova_lutheri.AAC.86
MIGSSSLVLAPGSCTLVGNVLLHGSKLSKRTTNPLLKLELVLLQVCTGKRLSPRARMVEKPSRMGIP